MFTIVVPKIDELPKGPVSIVSDRRVYIAEDGRTLVEHGDVSAATLLAALGGRIDSSDVARLNLSLVDGRVVQDAPAIEPEKVEASTEPEKVEVPADGSDAKPAAGKREKK